MHVDDEAALAAVLSRSGIVFKIENDVSRDHELLKLKETIAMKEKEAKEMETKLGNALTSIKKFHSQQGELFDDFVLLRDRYDGLKGKLRTLLWKQLPEHMEGMTSIPPIVKLEESDSVVGQWKLGKQLGEGQFAVVCEVLGCPSTKEFAKLESHKLAVKRIFKDRVNDLKNARRVNNEITILRDLHHPNIVRLYDIKHTEEFLYLVMERGGGDLFEYYRTHMGPASEQFTQNIASQLASVLNYLGLNGVVHRDLKPENILVNEKGGMKLVDFGLSTYHQNNLTIDDFCGTPGFFAPECLMEKTFSTSKLDMWGMGCCLLEMLLGHVRFKEIWMSSYSYEHLQNITLFTRDLSFAVQSVQHIFQVSSLDNEESKHDHSLRKTKVEIAAKKASTDQATRSRACCDFIIRSLEINPVNRMSSDEAMQHNFVTQKQSLQEHKKVSHHHHHNQPSRPDSGSDSSLYARRLKSNEKNPPIEPVSTIRISTPKDDELRQKLPPLGGGSPNVEKIKSIIHVENIMPECR